MSDTVQPDIILKKLGKLWHGLAHRNLQEGVLCARAMTIVVITGEQCDGELGETVRDLMHEHPSRVIVLRICRDAKEELRATVDAQCWTNPGSERQVCCEQIEITAPASRFVDVPKLVLGLVVPDLPVVVWVRNVSMQEFPEISELFALSDKLIFDSASIDGNERSVAFIRDLAVKGWNIADLRWTNLTPWRQMIAQIFEDKENRKLIARIGHVHVQYGGTAPSIEVQYLAKWIQHCLRRPIEFSFSGGEGKSIKSVTLEDVAAITREGTCATMRVKGVQQSGAFPVQNEFALLHEELSSMEPDRIFRECLAQ